MKNKVGYCAPPKSGQFQKGKSGNYKGRPKGARKSIANLIGDEILKKVRLNDGNKLEKQEIIAKQFVNEAIQKNDIKALKLILDITDKNDKKHFAQGFLDRLIKDNFITIENARAYALNRAPFYCDVSKKTLAGISKEAIAQQETAFDAVRFNEILSYLFNQHEICTASLFLFRIVQEEFHFWEGSDDTFDALKTSKEERQRIISILEKNREYPRPSSEIYGIAFWFHQICCRDFENAFLMVRNILKEPPYYEDFEQSHFSHEAKMGLLADAYESVSAPSLDNVLACFEQFKASYDNFMKLKARNLHEGEITKEEVLKLFAWIKTKQTGKHSKS